MKTIHKYSLEQKDGSLIVNEPFTIDMPVGAKVIDAQVQKQKFTGNYVPMMWAEIDMEKEKKPKIFWFIMTGYLLPEGLRHISTMQMRDGTLVPHLYEGEEEEVGLYEQI